MIMKSMRKIRDYKVLITDNRIEGVLGEAVLAKVGLTSVFIPKSGYSKWEKFKIDEESYNNAFHSLMSYLKHKEHFSIEDIRKWLED